ncbi:MAG TPA: hypothetical protein VFA18_12695 [Gemmataceae bacterium]|nr:hypothetical protein [Gemmataceae bacterium]
MWLFGQASSAARAALIYITVGALTIIWTAVWFVYLRNHPPETSTVYYFCGGLLATGVVLVIIGFGVGRIGRTARHADMPAEIAPPVAVAPTAAAAVTTTPVVTPANNSVPQRSSNSAPASSAQEVKRIVG